MNCRIVCKSCGVIINERPSLSRFDHFEYVMECEFCKPSSFPHDSDIVEKFSYVYHDMETEQIEVRWVRRTRKEVEEMKKRQEQWEESLMAILRDVELNFIKVKNNQQKKYQTKLGTLNIQLSCPFCSSKFIGEYWEIGTCDKCSSTYYWDENDNSLKWINGTDDCI